MRWIDRLCFVLFASFFSFYSLNAFAFPLDASKQEPHFYIQMMNDSQQHATISFQPVVGKISLVPSLKNLTPLLPHQESDKYGVVFETLGKSDQFNIVFSAKETCSFNVAFYAPYDPKITISGLGCFGGGYKIQGETLVLYISDIHLNK